MKLDDGASWRSFCFRFCNRQRTESGRIAERKFIDLIKTRKLNGIFCVCQKSESTGGGGVVAVHGEESVLAKKVFK